MVVGGEGGVVGIPLLGNGEIGLIWQNFVSWFLIDMEFVSKLL